MKLDQTVLSLYSEWRTVRQSAATVTGCQCCFMCLLVAQCVTSGGMLFLFVVCRFNPPVAQRLVPSLLSPQSLSSTLQFPIPSCPRQQLNCVKTVVPNSQTEHFWQHFECGFLKWKDVFDNLLSLCNWNIIAVAQQCYTVFSQSLWQPRKAQMHCFKSDIIETFEKVSNTEKPLKWIFWTVGLL